MATTTALTRSQARPSPARRRRRARAGFEGRLRRRADARRASTAGVALGTIYRYFSSKDHLLAEALVEWVSDLGRRVHARPPKGRRTADRVVEVLRRATHAMETDPLLSEALVTALASTDPHAARCRRRRRRGDGRRRCRTPSPTTSTRSVRDDIVRTLGHVWFSALVGWVNNWYGITQAGDELEVAAHLLLDQYE